MKVKWGNTTNNGGGLETNRIWYLTTDMKVPLWTQITYIPCCIMGVYLRGRMRHNYSEICIIFCCHPIVGHLLSSPVTRVSGTRLCTPGSSTPDMETWSTEQPAELNWAILFKTDSTSKSNTMHFNSFLPLSCRQFFFVQSSQSFWVIIVPHGLWHNCTIVWLKRSSSGSQPIFPAYQAESFMSGPGRGHHAVIGCRFWSILPDPSSRQRPGCVNDWDGWGKCWIMLILTNMS